MNNYSGKTKDWAALIIIINMVAIQRHENEQHWPINNFVYN